MPLSFNNAVVGGATFGPLGQAGGATQPGNMFGISGQDLWGGGGQSSQDQSTGSSSGQSGIWGAQAPYMQDLYGQAQNQFQNQSPYTNMAMNMRANRGMNGSPLNFGAKQGLMDTMSGAYMPGGEKYQDMSGAMINQMRPAVDSQFAGGRYGSGLHRQEMGNQLSDKLIANSNFERGNMMSAFGMAPQQAMQDYMDINQVAQAGNVPWQQLQQYQGLLGPAISQSTNQAQNQSTGTSQGTTSGGIVPGVSGIIGALA